MSLVLWAVANAAELDGRVIAFGRRLVKLSALEVLNFSFSNILEGLDGESRKRALAALEGRLGPNGGILIDDPDLPESLQGQEAPDWWKDDHDPFQDTFTVG